MLVAVAVALAGREQDCAGCSARPETPGRFILRMDMLVVGHRARSWAAAALKPKATANWVATTANHNRVNLRFAQRALP